MSRGLALSCGVRERLFDQVVLRNQLVAHGIHEVRHYQAEAHDEEQRPKGCA